MFQLIADTAVAAVQVVGLAMVMNGNPGVDVVLPRVQSVVGHTHQNNVQLMARQKVPTAPLKAVVDDHLAILAFHVSALLSDPNPGWDVRDLAPIVDGYYYVPLDGEHLRFITNAANDPAVVPDKLPHVSNGCIDPSTQKTRRWAPKLSTDYQPPAYPKAAAVLHLPNGLVTACLAKVKDVDSGRVDTRTYLVNNGTLVLEAKKGSQVKTLTFDGNALIMLANVPKTWLTGKTYSPEGEASHFTVYYSMLDPGNRNGCTRQTPPKGIERCERTDFKQPGGNSKTVFNLDLPEPAEFITADCSNSSYP